MIKANLKPTNVVTATLEQTGIVKANLQPTNQITPTLVFVSFTPQADGSVSISFAFSSGEAITLSSGATLTISSD